MNNYLDEDWFGRANVFNAGQEYTWTPSGDIDWSQSIADIDAQLYKKYALTDEEVDFIETRVKEME